VKWWRRLGIAIQILVFGELLFFAVAELYVLESGARLFRYAGF
jgi:hypothetical protein